MPDFLQVEIFIFYAAIGLLVGSFLNVCIYRLPRGTFFESSRSYCPHCHTELKWYELFPIFSYIGLKGRCRTCKEKISIRYPLVEAANMILWIAAYAVYGMSLYTVFAAVFFSVLIVMSMIDYDMKEIPDWMNITIAILGVIGFFIEGEFTWGAVINKLIGVVAMAVPFLIIGILTGGIGGGDVKLFAAAGLLLGWKLVILGGLIGVIVGGIIGVMLLIFKRAGKKTEMPLGPSLAVGFVIAVLFGQGLLSWYTGLLS